MTFNEAETLLGVHLQELGLPYQQHFRYVPDRKFEADFAVWRTERVRATTTGPDTWGYLPRPFALIEVQGGVYSKQAHGSVTGILKDNERMYHAFLNHWPMIRFTPGRRNSRIRAGEIIRSLCPPMSSAT